MRCRFRSGVCLAARRALFGPLRLIYPERQSTAEQAKPAKRLPQPHIAPSDSPVIPGIVRLHKQTSSSPKRGRNTRPIRLVLLYDPRLWCLCLGPLLSLVASCEADWREVHPCIALTLTLAHTLSFLPEKKRGGGATRLRLNMSG